MKKILSTLTVAAALLATAVSSPAQVVITGTPLGDLGQMPGSALDYSFFGGASPGGTGNDGGGAPDVGVHTDFTIATDRNGLETYGGDGRYSTVKNPLGVNTQTGILFGRSPGINIGLVDLKLGTSPTFNYADFNLYVMVGNGFGDGNVRNTAISVTDGSVVFNGTYSDTNSDLTKGTFFEFNITGASAGDTIVIGATGSPLNYLGGVSMESNGVVPEPSTYALMIGGLALLGLVGYRSRRLSA